MPQPATDLTLVADIGGTNTRVALARGRSVLPGPGGRHRRYDNASHPDIESVLRRFVADEGGVDPVAACVAAAGPVRDRAVTMTNIPHWPAITGEALARACKAEVVVILNDLQAQGHALGHAAPAHAAPILPFGRAAADATKLVIGVGTGFNVAPVFEGAGGRVVPQAEAGHVTLPVETAEDARLAGWLAANTPNLGFASVEEALSGRGVAQVYAWLADEDGATDDPAVRAILATTDGERDTRSERVLAALAQGDERAGRAVRVVARLLGSVAGNLALTLLPYGGIWLVGGMARALAPHLAGGSFAEGFYGKGRFGPKLREWGIGVGVVEDDDAALAGCAAHLAELQGRAAT